MRMKVQLDPDRADISGAKGAEATSAQVAAALIRARMVERVAPLIVSVVFILSACFLIGFAPDGREQAVTLAAVALAAVGLGLGGFSLARLRLPGVSVDLGVAAVAKSAPLPEAATVKTETLTEPVSEQPSAR
jgi:hypothetical protein